MRLFINENEVPLIGMSLDVSGSPSGNPVIEAVRRKDSLSVRFIPLAETIGKMLSCSSHDLVSDALDSTLDHSKPADVNYQIQHLDEAIQGIHGDRVKEAAEIAIQFAFRHVIQFG